MKTRITNLLPHPLSPTCHSDTTKKKLAAHIEATGLYPPLLVRTLHNSERYPSHNGHLQIIDGHLRYQVLKALGHANINVINFGPLSDATTEMLLLTLNHLKSPSNPKKRAELLKLYQQSTKHTLDQLTKFLPDSKITLQRLLALDSVKTLPSLADLPRPFAVYLSKSQYDLVQRTLEVVKKTTPARSAAQALEYLVKDYLRKSRAD